MAYKKIISKEISLHSKHFLLGLDPEGQSCDKTLMNLFFFFFSTQVAYRIVFGLKKSKPNDTDWIRKKWCFWLI